MRGEVLQKILVLGVFTKDGRGELKINPEEENFYEMYKLVEKVGFLCDFETGECRMPFGEPYPLLDNEKNAKILEKLESHLPIYHRYLARCARCGQWDTITRIANKSHVCGQGWGLDSLIEAKLFLEALNRKPLKEQKAPNTHVLKLMEQQSREAGIC